MLKNQNLLLIWILLSKNRPIFKFIFWAPNNHSRTCFSYWQYNGDELPIMSVARTIKITYHHLYWPLLFFAMPHKKITRFFKQPQTLLCIVYWVSEGELILPWQCSKFFKFFVGLPQPQKRPKRPQARPWKKHLCFGKMKKSLEHCRVKINSRSLTQ